MASEVEHKTEPKVSVHGIPKSQYDTGAQGAAPIGAGQDKESQEPGLKGNIKRNWPIYALVLGVITIIVIIMFSNNNSSDTSTTDPYGTGTGNSNPSDLYGSQLDSDYAQMINSTNETNALLQQLLSGKATTGSSGSKSGSGSSSHGKGKSSSGSKSGSSSGKKKTTSGGSTSTKKASGSSGATKKVTTHSGSTSTSKHATSVSHNSGKSSVKANPHAGGAKGWVYTTKPGDTVYSLSKKAWPGSTFSGGKGNPNLWTYANNKKILGNKYNNINTPIKPGTKLSL